EAAVSRAHPAHFPTRRSSDLCMQDSAREIEDAAHARGDLALQEFENSGRDSAPVRQGTSGRRRLAHPVEHAAGGIDRRLVAETRDRKSTRLNSSHVKISYAVF